MNTKEKNKTKVLDNYSRLKESIAQAEFVERVVVDYFAMHLPSKEKKCVLNTKAEQYYFVILL